MVLPVGVKSPGETLRVFISYAREDQSTVEKISEVLISQGISPLYDATLNLGIGFPDQIIERIAHAHVFVPLLTPNAATSNWVHQEIGCAVALRVPIVPVAIRCDPGEFIYGIQGVRLEDDTIEAITSRLSRDALREVRETILRQSAQEATFRVRRHNRRTGAVDRRVC